MNSSTAIVTSIIPTMQACLTKSTTEWLLRLYESGAVTFMPDGSVILNKEVRDLIHAMHAVLSGGQVKVEVIRDGGDKCRQLEDAFNTAWEDSNIARQYAMSADTLPTMP